MLVHMCCAPCSVYPLKSILKGAAEVWCFFNNPNIHPLSEFKKRLSAVKKLAECLSLKVIYNEEYRPMSFIKGVRGYLGSAPGQYPPHGARCAYCYTSRLEETARAAKTHGFDFFSSSLLYSRSQKHDEIKQAGAELEKKYGVPFYYQDFRPGWEEGIDKSKEMGLYRQKYCGCVYSRIERHAGDKKRQNKER